MLPTDHEARSEALDIRRSFIVKAPAGSGKTTLLVKRYLKLLSTVNHPEEVIAITFTRKAANEMIDRVLGAMRQVAEQGKHKVDDLELFECAQLALKQDQNKQWKLLGNPSRIRIQTIDALSQHLVRQMPWSAGFGAAPSSIEDDIEQLYLAAAKQALLSALADEESQSDAQSLLLALDNNFARFCDLLVNMLARRDQWQALLLTEFNVEDARHRLEKNWFEVVHHLLVSCDQKLDSSLKQELVICARYAAENLSTRQPDSPVVELKTIEEFPSLALIDVKQWRALSSLLLTAKGQLRKSIDVRAGFPTKRDGGDETLKARFKSLLQQLEELNLEEEFRVIQTLPEFAFSEQEWELLVSLVSVLRLATAQLMVIFQQQGVCDHIEIASRANFALGETENPTDLALRLDYQIQHLLVDEFQDTSHTQIELFKRLVAGWQADDGRTLFFVGDPMQSIYRFREADVGIFLCVFTHGFNSMPLDRLELTENFRSSITLVDWVNQKFTNIFPPKDDQQTAAVKYTASTAHKTEAEKNNQVKIHVTDKAAEAGAVCELIESVLASTDNSQDIAVLVRSRKHLAEIVIHLNESGIDYQGVKLHKLATLSCIQDIHALTKALCHPGDRLSWLAILRAPWCGLDLSSLTVIANKADNKTIWQIVEALDNDIEIETMHRLKRFKTILKPAMEKVGRVPLADIVIQVWQGLGGADTICVNDQVNINTYLQLLSKLESAGQIKQIDSLERAVNDLWVSTDTGQARLQLMTIHTAKGLEFDTVILPGLYRKPASDETELLIWNEFTLTDQSALLLSPIKINHQDNRRYNFVRSLEKNIQLEESKRLLYVACTRAVNQVHLFVSPKVAAASLQSLMHNQIQDEIEVAETELTENIIKNNKPILYQRLPADYQPPELEDKLTNLKNSNESGGVVEYQWAGITSIHIGTLIHEIIFKLAEQGRSAVRDKSQVWRNRLLALGIDTDQLDSAMQRIQQAVDNLLEDERAKWILQRSHRVQRNEWQLTSQTAEFHLENKIIDRTFIDENGIRWIIDYKTSSHEGGNIDDFLDSEQARYCSQLENYAQILRKNEENPIKLGLYFPLLAAWREWSYVG